MKITKQQVENVANLARLNLTEEEVERFTVDMESIISWIDKLNELNIENVSPTAHVIPLQNVFRKDEVKPSFDRDELLANAPSKIDGCYYVPKVVE